jgi:large subunit ribosomal protein L25
MKEIKLEAERREGIGKGACRKLRREGKIPAILYGPGEKPIPLMMDGNAFTYLYRSLRGEKALFNLKLKGDRGKKTIVKDLQRDPIGGKIIHVDFEHISLQKRITVEIPIHLAGIPKGVKEGGGVLEHLLREVEIECLPTDIPEHIEVDVFGLDIGDSIHVGDLELPNVRILVPPERSVATVLPPTVYKEAKVVEEKVEILEEKPEEKASEEEKEEE